MKKSHYLFILLGITFSFIVGVLLIAWDDKDKVQTASRQREIQDASADAGKDFTPEQAEVYGRKGQLAYFGRLLQAYPQPDHYVVEAFFTEWIKSDPYAAYAAALRLPKRFGYDSQNPFFLQQLRQLYGRDPYAALFLGGTNRGNNQWRAHAGLRERAIF